MIPSGAWRRTCAAVAVLAVVVGWGGSASAQTELRVRGKAQKYALLVGVDRYGKGTLLPGLAYPQRDVEGLAAVLLDSGYARDGLVVMTRNSGNDDFDLLPTADHVRNQLALLLKLVKPGDSILVMLAGHGVLMDAPPPGGGVGKPRPQSFFCPMDADLRKRDLTKLIAFDEFFDGLARSPATTKLLLVDACRNELKAAPPGARAPGIEVPPPPPPPPSVAALYACSEKEVSWEDSSLGGGHGVFSHFVIEGLKGAAADVENGNHDGTTTLDELTGYVRENVLKFVRLRRSVSQEPRLLGDVGRVVLRDLPEAKKGSDFFIPSRRPEFAGRDFERLPGIPVGCMGLLSCSVGESAMESEELRHGVFSHFLLEGLRGKAANGGQKEISFFQLAGYVQANVTEYSAKKYRRSQRPSYIGRVNGDPKLLPPARRGWALLVGSNSAGRSRLKYAETDMRDLGDLLQKNGYTVVLLTGDDPDPRSLPTKSNILMQFERMLAQTGPDDLMIFAFSGHGLSVDNSAYILPSDGNQKLESLISTKEIDDMFKNSKSNNNIIIIDAGGPSSSQSPSPFESK